MDLTAFLQRLGALAAPLRAGLARWRGPLTGMGLALFLAGTVWSFLGLGLTASQIDYPALVVLTLGMGFSTMAYSALSQMLMACAAGVHIGFVHGLRISARAQIAEALPLPGGAMVRMAALMTAGASAKLSAALVLGTAVLWISLAAIAAGLILAAQVPLAGWALLAGGVPLTLAALYAVARIGGPANAGLTLLHRFAGLALGALRIWLGFRVTGQHIDLADTLPYVLASVAGSASSLVPGGLGVSEALGALMAAAVHSSPQAAFLAVAVARITQFLGAAILAPLFEFGALRTRRA